MMWKDWVFAYVDYFIVLYCIMAFLTGDFSAKNWDEWDKFILISFSMIGAFLQIYLNPKGKQYE